MDVLNAIVASAQQSAVQDTNGVRTFVKRGTTSYEPRAWYVTHRGSQGSTTVTFDWYGPMLTWLEFNGIDTSAQWQPFDNGII